MYGQFLNDFIIELKNHGFEDNDIRNVVTALEGAMYNYDIVRKETRIVLYNQELPELAKKFIVTKKIEGLSELTLYNYTRFLQIFFFTTKKAPEQIKTDDIRAFLYYYKKERNVCDRSLDKVRDCLSSFFKWLYAEEYIERDPTLPIKKIKYEKRPVQALNEEELETVRRACKTLKEKAIVEMLYSTGCRVSELVGIKYNDINWKDKTVLIFGKGKKYRIAFLNIRSEFALKDYLNSRTDSNEYIFVSDRKPHNQLHKCGVEKIIRNIAARTNIEKKVTCHVFRHSTATLMLQRGAAIEDVKEILGHERINTTLIYAQHTMEHIKSEHKRCVI